MFKRVLLVIVIVSLMVIPSVGCLRYIPAEGIKVGLSAPDFSLPSVNNELITLSELRGQPVIINFWATWCVYCVNEMPYLQEIYEEYNPAGLVLLGVNVGESKAQVTTFKLENNLTFTFLLDSQRTVDREYAIRGYPTTFFIDRDGIIRAIKIGQFLSKNQIDEGIDLIMP